MEITSVKFSIIAKFALLVALSAASTGAFAAQGDKAVVRQGQGASCFTLECFRNKVEALGLFRFSKPETQNVEFSRDQRSKRKCTRPNSCGH